MKLEYEVKKRDLFDLYLTIIKKSSVIYLILSLLVFLFVMRNVILDNLLVTGILFFIYVIVILIFMVLINHLFAYIMSIVSNSKCPCGKYKCNVTKTSIKEVSDKNEYEIKLKDISKVDINKKFVIVYSRANNYMMFFKKSIFSSDDYERFISLIKKNR